MISWTRIWIPSCNLLLSSSHQAEQWAAERVHSYAKLLKPTTVYHNIPPPLMSAGHWCDQQPCQGSSGPRHSTFTSCTAAQHQAGRELHSTLAPWRDGDNTTLQLPQKSTSEQTETSRTAQFGPCPQPGRDLLPAVLLSISFNLHHTLGTVQQPAQNAEQLNPFLRSTTGMLSIIFLTCHQLQYLQ